jgi:maltose alpha-D-glucosyltransferase / alpha-amylase
MVTDEERELLWKAYAADPQMRINLGIRRRLAPLVDNDRRCIELLTSLLLTLPGSPILYYGDEIGMGDNCALADRDGVRTPMQWSSERNAGFSTARRNQLYSQVVDDPVYGYQAVNVAAQLLDSSSLLRWMQRLLEVRRQHPVFGRGSIEFLDPENPKVLAYVRGYEDQRVLIVCNLAASAQPVELDLRAYAGCDPVELLGEARFPRIGALPYVLSLAPYGYFWFRLAGGNRPMPRAAVAVPRRARLRSDAI